jgi:2,4-dienoyl-CoA reductase-like NADH-dependent reductase (Old Yellow Enzyme family)
MAEAMAPSHIPDEKFLKAYGEWQDGGWGLIMTGNVQVSDTYLGSPGDVAILSQTSANPSNTTKEIWKKWAATCQRSGTPAIVQLCHPGRQSPPAAGNRSFFAKTIAPSAVKLNFGDNLIARAAVAFMFGTPREMTVEEIAGEEGAIEQFVAAAKQVSDAGFKGVELHGA